MPLDREQILEALRQCYDPEIPINIVDLGLIYDVEHDDAGNVTVKMTLTTQGCPSALAIPDQVRSRDSRNRRSARRESRHCLGAGLEPEHDQPEWAAGAGPGSVKRERKIGTRRILISAACEIRHRQSRAPRHAR